MSYDKDIRKRHRIYSFMSYELAYEGMTLWEFCQAIMQLPADARIYKVRDSWNCDSVELLVGSKDFDEVKDGECAPIWIYDHNQRTFIGIDK